MLSNNLIKLILLAICLTYSGIVGKSFYSKGEPREALVPQAMLATQDWILPVRYGDEFATKPPFSHWISASFSSVFGEVTELTTRLPAAILALLTLLAFYVLIRKETSPDLAFLSGLILLSSVEWHRASITSRVDMTLSAMCIFALISFYNWEKREFKGFALLALLGMTGATLSKGPVGLILPSAIAGAFFLTQRHSLLKSTVRVLQIALPALALSSLWYLAAYQRGGEEFLNTFLLENFARFQGTMEAGEDPHNHSALYLYGTLIIGSIPWSVLIILSYLKFVPDFLKRMSFPTRAKLLTIWQRFLSLPGLDRLSIIIIFFYLLFFSIPSSKRSVYILPIYPFVSYFLAKAALLSVAASPRINSILIKTLTTVSLFICLLALTPLAELIELSSLIKSESALREIGFYKNVILSNSGLSAMGLVSTAAIFLSALGTLFVAIKHEKQDRYKQTCNLAFVMCAGLLIANLSLIKSIANGLSAKTWAQKISAQIDKTLPMYTYPGKNYGLNFYMQGMLKELKEPLQISSSAYVFVSSQNKESLIKNLSTRSVTTISESPNPIEKTINKITLIQVHISSE